MGIQDGVEGGGMRVKNDPEWKPNTERNAISHHRTENTLFPERRGVGELMNEDETTDLAPISSFGRWMDDDLGLVDGDQTADNFARHRECVVNFADPRVAEVESGAAHWEKPGTDLKAKQFHYEPRKFEAAGLTPWRARSLSQCERKNAPFKWRLENGVAQLAGGRLEELGEELERRWKSCACTSPAISFGKTATSIRRVVAVIYNFRPLFQLADES